MMRLIEGMSHKEALHFQHRAQRNGFQANIIGSVMHTNVPERTERSIRMLYEANILIQQRLNQGETR